ncbi:XP_036369560.1uncharacterized protein LOC118768009 isoform X1 [Octopus vulgaris]|uniref:XP_036369560.1uncharacterized protein LOC118768009 isoform X1 n=1 Tax=Octopus vulgaris TaxID=6645 RepID=A0AA36FHC9_OCTVU|nr:XP_036369560.1uncharacterized protein LOC118768009 isoform X1 [Octopus vulgaris]
MDILVKLRPKFVELLTQVEEILDHLVSEGIFTVPDVTSVSSCPNRSNQIRRLLDILTRKLPSNIEKFYEILLLTNNQILADEITRFTSDESAQPTPYRNLQCKYPIQEEGNRYGYIVSIDGCIQEDYFQTFITNYTRKKYIDYKSVLITDFPMFLNKEVTEMSSECVKYDFALYFVMCDSQFNTIHEEDYFKQVVTLTEVIFSENVKPHPLMCLICCEDCSIEEIFKSTDHYVIAALRKDHFRDILNNFPGDLSSVFLYVKNMTKLS